MKVLSVKLRVFIFFLSLFLIQSCRDEEVVIPPVLTTTNVTAISYTIATSGGNVTNTGGGSITSRGVCWDLSSNPTIEKSKTEDGTGSGAFTSNITGLSANTKYFVRAYAMNSSGIAYGEEVSFTTSKVVAPTLTTTVASAIFYTTATSGGNISNTGGGSITSRGVCWDLASNPTIEKSKTEDGTGSGSFASSITGLSANTKYFVRAYAINSSGIAYGEEVSFTTLKVEPPSLSASAITYIGDKLATSGGNVTSDNGSVVTEKGVCWNTAPAPTINNNKTIDGTGTGAFISSLTGLSPNTIYYSRAYATNSAGTSYSNELSFETFELIDIDGNGYNTVTIGSQVWLDRNLRTAKYRNGDLIPTSTTPSLDITGESSPKYQWAYEGDINNVVSYGRLYTWYVATDNRNVCPTDWHVPTESEQMTLTTYLGGPTIAGGKLKESGTTHWLFPNTDATNSSLFTALPGGLRYSWGQYLNKGSLGFFWSTSDRDVVTGYDLYLNKDNGIANHSSWDKNFGMSIRCIKD